MEFFTPEHDKAALTPQTEQKNLPAVLLIGDSIANGYTGPVRELLKDVCQVHGTSNAGDTRKGLEAVDAWLGPGEWDLIHFNWGLHDIAYRHPDATVYGNRDKINGTLSVDPEQYRTNLEALVELLCKRARKLVWGSTTYVPEGEAGRFQGDEVRYNAIAEEIMKRRGIPINDLHALTSSFGPEMFWRPCDVHYSEAGNVKIAEQVAQVIEQQAQTV